MPSFPIVDSHVHLYDVARLRYPWLRAVPKIERTYLLKDFDAARDCVEVDKIVFADVAVAAGQHLEEAAFVQGLADHDARLCGMVAHLPAENGLAIEPDIVALKKFKTLRGIRRLIEGAPDPSFCLEPGFIAGVKLIGKHGLSFDICVKHWAMVFAIELVKRCPDVQFVLDHIGKPGVKHGLHEPWWGQIRELSRLPNIVCKVSGVITETDHAHWRKEQAKPFVARVIDCFRLRPRDVRQRLDRLRIDARLSHLGRDPRRRGRRRERDRAAQALPRHRDSGLSPPSLSSDRRTA